MSSRIVGVILTLAYCKHKREKAEIAAEKKAAEKRRRSHTPSERQISRASERNVRQVAAVQSKSKVVVTLNHFYKSSSDQLEMRRVRSEGIKNRLLTYRSNLEICQCPLSDYHSLLTWPGVKL
uniref:Secreted protein n=1 Tax=Panagrellus redivivus TaxID=6233 RepID=A0A7E4W806_PANRE